MRCPKCNAMILDIEDVVICQNCLNIVNVQSPYRVITSQLGRIGHSNDKTLQAHFLKM
jgi:DNA-directed RNA polymerase subunit M/transcription elongation factor TFIIS